MKQINFYSIQYKGEIRYYSNLRKLCRLYNIDDQYDNIYYAINRSKSSNGLKVQPRGYYSDPENLFKITKITMNQEPFGIECECGKNTPYGFNTLCPNCS